MGKRRKGRKSKPLLSVLERDIAILDSHRFDNDELEDMRSNLVRRFITQTELTQRQKAAVHRLASPIRRKAKQVRTKLKRSRPYFVYAIHDGAFIKVGYAWNPEKRMKDMQTSNASKLSIVAKIRCEKMTAAKRLEKQIHKYGREWHVRGEWFKEEVMAIFDQFADQRKRSA